MTKNQILSLAWLLIVSSFDSFAAVYSSTNGDSTKCPDRCDCSKYFRSINCEHKHLQEIPPGIPVTATELFLGHNELAEIDTGSFSTLENLTYLDLVNNQITVLRNRSFAGLRNLRRLTLRKNKLASISRDAFWGLISLQRLYLTHNLLTLVPDLTFAPNLIYLTVDTNYLESASLCGKTTNLTKLSTVKLSNNAKLTIMQSDDFKCVNRLSVRSIDISRCKVTNFSDGVFSFPHLQSLSLSYNSIPYDMLRRIFRSIVPSDLTSLDLSGVLQPINLFPSDLFADLTGLKLDHLSLAHTSKVSVIQNGTFQYFPYLKYLDLSYSEFTEIFDESLSHLTNLKRISLNRNRKISSVPKFNISSLEILELNNNPQIEQLNYGTFSGLINLTNLTLQNCKILTIKRGAFNGLAKLESLNLAGNLIAGSAFPRQSLAAMKSLIVLDLSFNKITTVPTQYDLFAGLHALQWLDFSNNNCKNISTRIFQPLNLTYLNLAGNLLGEVVSRDTDGRLFNGLVMLQHLRLDDNRLTSLPDRLLVGLVSLKFLNLSENLLTAWPQGMIAKSTQLDVIQFSSNRIATVTAGELTTLPDETRLNLTANPFACDCDLVWFGRWIADHNTTDGRLINLGAYKCNSPDAMAGKPLIQFNPDDVESRCHQLPLKWILVGACSGLVAVMLFCVTVAYRYRWPLRLRVYYLRRLFRSPSDDRSWQNEIDGFDYDIFISYGPSDKDRNWVKSELMPRFDRNNAIRSADDNNDSERQPLMFPDGPDGDADAIVTGGEGPPPILGRWRVFIEEEEATFGQLEFNTLAESIFKSRKLILVISDEYLNDGRRQIEIELAVTSRIENRLGFDSIIVVFLEPDADVSALRTLRCIMDKRGEPLLWPEDDAAGQELFWQQLSEAIQSRPDVALLAP